MVDHTRRLLYKVALHHPVDVVDVVTRRQEGAGAAPAALGRIAPVEWQWSG